MDTLIGFLEQPLFKQLVQVRQALERSIALEEVVLHVADHPLHLALGPGPIRTARLGHEAVVPGELLEALVEAHRAGHVLDDRRLLIVDPDLAGDAPEPGEGLHQALVGVLGVGSRCGHHVEAP